MSRQAMRLTHTVPALLLALLALTQSGSSDAMPVFARKYNLSCSACHVAFPRLNAFGEQFIANNLKLPNWKESATRDVGDPLLVLPESVPLAIRAQAFVQSRNATAIDETSGTTTANASTDIQSPYLIKLLSSAPLSEHITYYFYGIFAEKGGNGETLIEDAWFRHDDVFGSGLDMMLGQYQLSDLMFPRETRLTFQDFMAYRMAGITYDRGLQFGRAFGPLEVALGVANGNGVTSNFAINSPGYQRADRIFDNDNSKSVYGRIGMEAGPVGLGVFALSGRQRSIALGNAGLDRGLRDTDKRVVGLDLSGNIDEKLFWFAQSLWNRWDGFLDADPNKNYAWFGGFAGVDYIANDRWAYSLLYNHADASDLKDTDTIYEGIDMSSITLGASYYFMRNVKGVIEVNYDLLDKKDKTGTYWTGHLNQEHYVLLGFDAAF
jgi:hypothetical protein